MDMNKRNGSAQSQKNAGEKSQDNHALLFAYKSRLRQQYRTVFALWLLSMAATYGNIFGAMLICFFIVLLSLGIHYGHHDPDTIHGTGDSLWVARRGVVEEIPFANILRIMMTEYPRHHCIIMLGLREPGKFGRCIRFSQRLKNDQEPPFLTALRDLIRLYPSGQHQQIERLLAPPPDLSHLHRPIDMALIQTIELVEKGDLQGAERVYRQFIIQHPTVDASPLIISISEAWLKAGKETEATSWLERLQSGRS